MINQRRYLLALARPDITYARRLMPQASCVDVRLIAMHKARYECNAARRELRLESAQWLRKRGLGAMADRGLLPIGELP